jgi:hypothetical protein
MQAHWESFATNELLAPNFASGEAETIYQAGVLHRGLHPRYYYQRTNETTITAFGC